MARLAALLVLTLAASAADLPPHLRKEPNRSLRWKEIKSSTVDFNRGEVRAEVGEHVHVVRVIDKTVKSAFAPEAFSYFPGVSATKKIAPLTVDVVKYQAGSYKEASMGLGAKFTGVERYKMNGQSCQLFQADSGPIWRAIYADPAARDLKPFTYYVIGIMSTRGLSDPRTPEYLKSFFDSLKIRTPGLKAPSAGGECLPFAG